MKRLPLIFSLLAVIALSASVAYWAIELYKPKQRPLAPIAEASMPEPAPDAAATLFGGQAVTATVSNYRLTGVVAAGRDSAAILVADGQPPRALKVGSEITPGVTVREVYPRYVILSEGGVMKRIDLAADDKAGTSLGLSPVVDASQQGQQGQPQPSQIAQQAPPQPPPQPLPQQQMQQMQQQLQPDNGNQIPGNQPMDVPNMPGNMPAGSAPPPPPVQMPAPTRNFSNPNAGGQPPTQ
jgi:general secretion pathway protein C